MNIISLSKIIFDVLKDSAKNFNDVTIFHGDSSEIGGSHLGTEVIIYPLNAPKIGTGGEKTKAGKLIHSQIWEQKFQITTFDRNDRVKAQDVAIRLAQWFGLSSVIKENGAKGVSFKRIEAINSIRFDNDNDSHNVAFIFELSAIYETNIEFDADYIVDIEQTLIQGV